MILVIIRETYILVTTNMDYVRHGKIQGRKLKKDHIAALYVTMSDIVHTSYNKIY